MTNATKEKVLAVVVNHDAGDALLECVASLREGGIEQVVVVDNASSDGSLERLANTDRKVVLVPNGKNLGYGSAANRGATRGHSEFVLVSNPDLVLGADAIKILVAELDAHPEVAAVGPRILDQSGALYPSARAFPNYLDAAGHALFGMFVPNNPFSRRYRMASVDPGAGRDVDWVSGAFVLLRRVAFDSVGGFDEGYFMYVEDLDLCWRLHRAGWSVRYVPDAVVVHRQGLSTDRHPWRMMLAHHRSTWRYASRRAEGPERALLPLVAAGLSLRLVLAVGREISLRRGRGPEQPD